MKFELNVPIDLFEEFKAEVIKTAKKFKVTGKVVKGAESLADVYDPRIRECIEHPVYACRVEIAESELEKFNGTGEVFLGSIFKDVVVSVGASPEGIKKGVSLASLSEEIKSMACAECGKKISSRKKLYVFETPSGMKTYGTTCAKLKFGINFERIIKKFSRLKSHLSGWIGGYERDADLATDFVALAYHRILYDGYVSKGRSWEAKEYEGRYLPSTDSLAWSDHTMIYYSHDLDPYELRQKEEIIDWLETATEFPVAELREIGVYDPAKVDIEDFHFNMKAAIDLAVDHNMVTRKTSGFIAYATFRLIKSQDEAARKASEPAWRHDHGLDVGDKIKDVKVRVIAEHCFDTNYGEKAIYTFKSEEGFKFKWFTDPRFDKHDWVTLKSGTVKSLEDHPKFGKAVLLTRCRAEIH